MGGRDPICKEVFISRKRGVGPCRILGVTPDCRVKVRVDVLSEIDGPMLKHGLQEFDGAALLVPSRQSLKPDRRSLEERSKPQLIVVDLQGLPQPEKVLGDLQMLMPPGRVLVLSALGTIEDQELDRLGFRHVKRPIAVADVVATVRNAMGCSRGQ